MEATGKITDISVDYKTKHPKITLELNTSAEDCEKLKDTELTINLQKHREKRSLNANNYLWKLCSELAKKKSVLDKEKYTKEHFYLEAIKEIGVWRDDEVEPEKVKWRCTAWERLGTGWITERVDFTSDGNKEIIRFYYGSSQYNTEQMSKLIDNIVQDCKAMGIETATPDEIAKMKSLWRDNGCEA